MVLAAALVFTNNLVLSPENGFSGVDADGKGVSISEIRTFTNGGWSLYKWDGKEFSLNGREGEKNYRPGFSRWNEGDGGIEFELEEMPTGEAPIYSLQHKVVWTFQKVEIRFYKYQPGSKRDYSIVYSRRPWKNVGVVWADGQKGGSAIQWKGVRLDEVKQFWLGKEFVIDWVQVMDSPGKYGQLTYLYDGLDRSKIDRQATFVWKDGVRERAREFWMDREPSKLEFIAPTAVCYRTHRSLKDLDRVEIQERPVLVAEVKGLVIPADK